MSKDEKILEAARNKGYAHPGDKPRNYGRFSTLQTLQTERQRGSIFKC